jgi:DNA-binding GntR family transcriptional regulator
MPDEVKRPTPTDIHAILRDRICFLEAAPGTLLREAELAAEFGVSRTPVREALQKLSWLGLVEIRNGVGTLVTPLDMDVIRDAYEMRLKVAELIGHMAPRPITDSHVARAKAHLDRARALVGGFDVAVYCALNHDLHYLIASIIGNGALRDDWHRLYFQTARAWYGVARTLGDAVARDFEREVEDVRIAFRRDDPVALGYAQRNAIHQGFRRVFPA